MLGLQDLWRMLVWLALACAVACGTDDAGSQNDDPSEAASSLVVYTPYGLWLPDPVTGVVTVKVCWYNFDPSGKWTAETQLVKDALLRTWSTVARIKFVGWQECASSPLQGTPGMVRVSVSDVRPNADVGRLGSGESPSVVLNFTYNNWDQGCRDSTEKRKLCIQHNAIHEFGHILGLSHEHVRGDTPTNCAVTDLGGPADYWVSIGDYDPDSIMNYCSSRRVGLSLRDSVRITELYGSSFGNQPLHYGDHVFVRNWAGAYVIDGYLLDVLGTHNTGDPIHYGDSIALESRNGTIMTMSGGRLVPSTRMSSASVLRVADVHPLWKGTTTSGDLDDDGIVDANEPLGLLIGTGKQFLRSLEPCERHKWCAVSACSADCIFSTSTTAPDTTHRFPCGLLKDPSCTVPSPWALCDPHTPPRAWTAEYIPAPATPSFTFPVATYYISGPLEPYTIYSP